MNDEANQLDRLTTELATGDRDVDDATADRLLAFKDELDLRSERYGDARKLKLLRHCTIIAEGTGQLTDAITSRDAAEDVVRWIHDHYENAETNRDCRVAVRVFAKLLAGDDQPTDDDGFPTTVAWISATTSSDYDPTPDPSEMLRWESDIQAMLEACRNTRDAALVAFQFDAGLRGSELDGIRIGDLSDNDYGLQVTVDGKQGQRTVTLIPSVPYVQRWLGDHPRGDDDTAPLWGDLDDGDPISYAMLRKILDTAAARADVTKPTTPTNFRKSSAAHLASQGMNQAHIEEHHGWVRGSRVASRYVSVFAEDADRALAETYGKDVDESEAATIAPLACPRCGQETPREKDLCVWCGQALEPGAAEQAEELDDVMVTAIANSEGEQAQRLIELRDDLQRSPETLDDVMERLAPLLDE